MEEKKNGSDKDVGSMEKLIEVRPDELSKGGLKLFEYINEIIDRNKELKEKWDKDTHSLQNDLDLANADKINNYIPVSLVEEKIKELIKEGRHYNANKIEVLQELLEKRK